MNPDLVGAAGARAQFQPRAFVRSAQDTVIGDGPFSRRVDRHLPSAAADELSEPAVDAALILERPALDNSPIDLFDIAFGEHRAEPAQRLRMAAEDETAAGVAIEPVGEGRRVW